MSPTGGCAPYSSTFGMLKPSIKTTKRLPADGPYLLFPFPFLCPKKSLFAWHLLGRKWCYQGTHLESIAFQIFFNYKSLSSSSWANHHYVKRIHNKAIMRVFLIPSLVETSSENVRDESVKMCSIPAFSNHFSFSVTHSAHNHILGRLLEKPHYHWFPYNGMSQLSNMMVWFSVNTCSSYRPHNA